MPGTADGVEDVNWTRIVAPDLVNVDEPPGHDYNNYVATAHSLGLNTGDSVILWGEAGGVVVRLEWIGVNGVVDLVGPPDLTDPEYPDWFYEIGFAEITDYPHHPGDFIAKWNGVYPNLPPWWNDDNPGTDFEWYWRQRRTRLRRRDKHMPMLPQLVNAETFSFPSDVFMGLGGGPLNALQIAKSNIKLSINGGLFADVHADQSAGAGNYAPNISDVAGTLETGVFLFTVNADDIGVCGKARFQCKMPTAYLVDMEFDVVTRTYFNANNGEAGGAVPASVAGAVGSVTGAVGSVTGNVGGSVGSVTGGATATALATVDTVVDAIKVVTDKINFDADDNVETTPYVAESAVAYTDQLTLGGVPLAECEVWATSSANTGVLQSTETDASGNFTLMLDPGAQEDATPYIHAKLLGVAEHKTWQIEYVNSAWAEV
jgi:hypothetical protein